VAKLFFICKIYTFIILLILLFLQLHYAQMLLELVSACGAFWGKPQPQKDLFI
ncbi:hypothetical protein M2142_000721, partial [Fusobacterium sp. PH5-29]